MQLDPKHGDQVLNSFLASWGLDRIRKLTISDYADMNDHDSLCYWLEYGTEKLGSIGGLHLNKFELWKPGDYHKTLKDDRFNRGGGYFWNKRFGEDLDESFGKIRKMLEQIVNYSQQGDWLSIEEIRFHAIGKWKLAFLFSGKRLLPVYSKRALLAIARGLGFDFTGSERVVVLQEAILSRKPTEEDVIEYSYRMYSQYAIKIKVQPQSYFLVGCNYSGKSVLDVFLKQKCIAMGWLDWLDFGALMGSGTREVNDFVFDGYTDKQPALYKVQGFFRLFSQIKEGDIIAIKSQGRETIKIVAYAQVVKRDGNIYFHDEMMLGHHIHVEFLEAGLSKTIIGNYATTIHQLTEKKDGEVFRQIFGWYAGAEVPPGMTDEEDRDYTSSGGLTGDEDYEEGGYNTKNEEDFERSPMAAVIVRRLHNRIQNRFIEYLEKTYPGDVCMGEKRYVDAKRISSDKIYIYEIKPFSSVYACIRQGIGQLMDYMHQNKQDKEKHLVIVGSGIPGDRDLAFIRYLQGLLNVPFSYLMFNADELTAQEY